MIVIYVRHYLNQSGLEYFKSVWFPEKVYKVISSQPGFLEASISIDQSLGCGSVVVKFQDQESLEHWIAKPEHRVVDLLDPYRTKSYWKAARTSHPVAENCLDDLEWNQISAKIASSVYTS